MKKLLLLLAITTIIFACTSQESPSLQSDLASLASPSQTFTIDPGQMESISTSSGILIFFPSGSLVDSSGNVPTTSVSIEILEASNRTNMILNSISTIAGRNVIESAGMFHIRATSNGKELTVKKGDSIHAEFINNTTSSGFELFYGLDSKGITEWAPIAEVTERITTNQPGMKPDTSIQRGDLNAMEASEEEAAAIIPINFKKLGWINCDRFIDIAQGKPITIASSGSPNSVYYIIFEEINSVLAGYAEKSSNQTDKIPPGFNVTVLMIDKRKEDLYMAKYQFETGKIDSIHLDLKLTSKGELLEVIQKFDQPTDL